MPDAASMSAKTNSIHSWKVPCVHPDYISKDLVHDFSILASGAQFGGPSVGGRWKGAFSGRPDLLTDLMPALARMTRAMPPNQANACRNAVVSFFRFLDAFEEHLTTEKVPLVKVTRLHHITAMHMKYFTVPGPGWEAAQGSPARVVRAAIREMIEEMMLPGVFMAAIPDPRNRRETPSEKAGLRLIDFLRELVSGTLERWRRADSLAATGRNLLVMERDPHPGRGRPSLSFVPSEADAHATYRALIEVTGKVAPTTTDLAVVTGCRLEGDLPMWWPKHAAEHERAGKKVQWREVVEGLYPTAEDVAVFHLLFLARSAWNAVTAASIHLDSWNSPYDDEHCWIFAPKPRSRGELQWTISKTVGKTSSFALVSVLAERGRRLRELVSKEPALANLPDVAARSPWVGLAVSGYNPVFVVDPYATATLNNRLKSIIDKCNASYADDLKVPMMTTGDFRDLAAAIVYKESKYSSWMVHLLLGHKLVRTTRDYGFRRASLAESFGQVRMVVNDIFSQIEDRSRFDIVLTRAKVQGMSVSEEDVLRLEAARRYRTYDGCGCADPYSPPASIDPGNRRDGCTVCVQQHRCAASGCPNAFVFNDSLSHLCKRVAELDHLKGIIGFVRFDEGSEGSDLAALTSTLTQWPKSDVDAEVSYWKARIEDGTHKPIQFAGQHR